MIRIQKEVISQLSFYALVFFLPLNLGYHFMISTARQNGLVIDYLIPTLYLQDIVALILVLSNLGAFFQGLKKTDKFLIWFMFAVALSCFSSEYMISSLSSFARLFLYVAAMIIVKHKYRREDIVRSVSGILSFVVILLFFLALLQWKRQGSVFDSYLYFGEQPYSASTYGINVESFLGRTRVPSYGTFRHPNVFGGILSILLLWFLMRAKEGGIEKTALVLGVPTLLFTLSSFSWISLAFGIAFFFMTRIKGKRKYRGILAVVGLVVFLGLLLPFLPEIRPLSERPSFYRRSDLLNSSYRLIGQKPLFGYGYGTSAAKIDELLPSPHDVRFAQPPHNMFVLLLMESGVFALLFFSLFLFGKVRESLRNPMMFVSLMQVMILGSFDHYFFTIHQPQLLLWLILGLI